VTMQTRRRQTVATVTEEEEQGSLQPLALTHLICPDPVLLCIHVPALCPFVCQIEPMNRESDSLQIVCLSNLLGVGVRVAYLDQSAAAESSAAAATAPDSMRTYDFPEGAQPRVHLLYRPGHYDVLTVAAPTAAQ
jgi:hypothetical protein